MHNSTLTTSCSTREFIFAKDDLNAEDVWARIDAEHKARRSVWLSGKLVEPLARQFGVERGGQFWIRLEARTKHSEWIYRVRDILFSAAALVFLSPILVLIAILVKLSSAGPIFYETTGIGRAKQHFAWLKFRSMQVRDPAQDQTDRRERFRLYAQHKQTGKVIDAQRVTWLGAFLRKHSLDELPQFWNVLRGEMALVGPRPCLPYEMEFFPKWASRRFQMRPGLTGLWQVNGRGEVTLEEGLFMDVYHVYARTFRLEFRLMLDTLRIMLFGQGDK